MINQLNKSAEVRNNDRGPENSKMSRFD